MMCTQEGQVSVADYENLVAEGRKLMERVSLVQIKQASWNDDLKHFHLVEEKQKEYMRALSSEVESGVVESMTNPVFVQWFAQYDTSEVRGEKAAALGLREASTAYDDRVRSNSASRVWHGLPWFHHEGLTALTDFVALVPFPRQLTEVGEALVTDALDELSLSTFCVHTVSVRTRLADLARTFLGTHMDVGNTAQTGAIDYTRVDCHAGKDVLHLCAHSPALREALTHTPCLFLSQRNTAVARLCLRGLVIRHRCVAVEGVMDSTVRACFDASVPASSRRARAALVGAVQRFIRDHLTPHLSTPNSKQSSEDGRGGVDRDNSHASNSTIHMVDSDSHQGKDAAWDSSSEPAATPLRARSYNIVLLVRVNMAALNAASSLPVAGSRGSDEAFVLRVLNMDSADTTCFEMFTPDEMTVISHATSRRTTGAELGMAVSDAAELPPVLRLWGCLDATKKDNAKESDDDDEVDVGCARAQREIRAAAPEARLMSSTLPEHDDDVAEAQPTTERTTLLPTPLRPQSSDEQSARKSEAMCGDSAGDRKLTSKLSPASVFSKTAAAMALTAVVIGGVSRSLSLLRRRKPTS